MAENLENTSIVWKQIADMWSTYFTPPSRISPDEVKQYANWLRQLKHSNKPMKALVLGATPEIRDALNDLGYETTIIDINMEMILAMNSLMKTKNPNEIIVRANWLDNPLQSGYFDVVLGDAVLPNIPWSKREALLSEVRRLLAPDGVFITRAFCMPNPKPFASLKELLIHFASKPPTNQSALEFIVEVQSLYYDPKDHLGTFSKPKEVVESLIGKSGYNLGFESESLSKIMDIVLNFWSKKFIDKVFVYAYRDEEETEYRKFFEITETYEARDNGYSRITPMYVLRMKR